MLVVIVDRSNDRSEARRERQLRRAVERREARLRYEIEGYGLENCCRSMANNSQQGDFSCRWFCVRVCVGDVAFGPRVNE
jgi:hypothetical protein